MVEVCHRVSRLRCPSPEERRGGARFTTAMLVLSRVVSALEENLRVQIRHLSPVSIGYRDICRGTDRRGDVRAFASSVCGCISHSVRVIVRSER